MYSIFKSIFETHPQKSALIDNDMSITFAELSDHVERCSRELKELNNNVIAICTKSRIEFIILVISCIKIEKPFLPIDFNKPENVINEQISLFNEYYYISKYDVKTGKLSFKEIKYPLKNIETINPLENFDNSILSFMFTSGSTGKPKCVMVPKIGVINLLKNPGFFKLEKDDIFATYSPLSFDASTFEIFTPLLNGNTLICLDKFDVIDSNILKQKCEFHGITCMWVTAGLFNEQVLSKNYAGLKSIKKLFVGGDKVSIDAAKIYLENSAGNQLFNGYGPTENTVFTCVCELTRNNLLTTSKMPIGKLISGVSGIILDEQNNIIEGTGTGTLHVTGKGLSSGYFNNPEATQSSFVSMPAYPGEVFYNTGDLVFRDPNEVLFFIGRRDRQVKLNGHRVDLNALEERCLSLDIFEHVIFYYSQVNSALVCIYKGKDDTLNDGIASTLKLHLNFYEIPKHYSLNNEWPLSENGKLDIKTIIKKNEEIFKSENIYFTKKSTQKENHTKGIMEITNSLLGFPINNKNLNFFDAGFDSITLVRLQSGIAENYGLNISLLDLYEIGTIAALEESIMKKSWIDEQEYYLQQTVNTNLGAFSYLGDNVPSDIKEIFKIARNVVEHHAGINTEKISLDRYPEMEIDKVSDIFAILHKNGVRDITQPIALHNKVIGNCFNISKVAVSLLRHKGIPARIRYAYCTYFYDDFNHEQALVEYWDKNEQIWRRGDASMNEEIMVHLNINVDIDLLNVSTELSQPIADVWIGCRTGTLSFENYGASVDTRKRGGLGHVAHKLTHDLACLNQVELMACDFIGPTRNYFKSKNLKLDQFDKLAVILKDVNYKSLQYNEKQVPFCVTPRRILRKSRFTGINVK